MKDKHYTNPHNEVASSDPNKPEGSLYDDYQGVIQRHGSPAHCKETPNSRSGGGIMGGPAPGEPNPSGSKGTAGKGRSKG